MMMMSKVHLKKIQKLKNSLKHAKILGYKSGLNLVEFVHLHSLLPVLREESLKLLEGKGDI